MKFSIVIPAFAVATVVLIETLWAQAPAGTAPQPTMPIKQLMETTITDASNAIWAASDPPTSAEQWAALEKAALAVIPGQRERSCVGFRRFP